MRIGIVAVLLALPSLASGSTISPIPSGSYHCTAGTKQLPLALGNVPIIGNGYVFNDPQGRANAGSYALTRTGYRWSGDLGVMRADRIIDSGPDATPGDFWVRYTDEARTATGIVTCRRQ